MKILDHLPGFFAVLVLASLAFYVSTLHASFDALVISIIIGMFAGNLIGERNYFMRGAESAIRTFLPLGIALYGTQLVFNNMKLSSVSIILAIFLFLFGTTIFLARVFGLERKLGILLASGLSVCGASAIAIIAPLIGAKREDTSISIVSVMMLGLTGMLFYPIVSDIFSLSREQYNLLAGTTLPMLGQVKIAASNFCPDCVEVAVRIKLIRISFLVFLVTTAIFLSGKEKKQFTVPWFIVLFIAFAVLGNVTGVLVPFRSYLGSMSGFLLSVALTGIGFSVDFNALIEKGLTPLGVIFISWVIVLLTLFLFMGLTL